MNNNDQMLSNVNNNNISESQEKKEEFPQVTNNEQALNAITQEVIQSEEKKLEQNAPKNIIEDFSVFQFLKYHTLKPQTVYNIKPMFYGVHYYDIEGTNIVKYYKQQGFITGLHNSDTERLCSCRYPSGPGLHRSHNLRDSSSNYHGNSNRSLRPCAAFRPGSNHRR